MAPPKWMSGLNKPLPSSSKPTTINLENPNNQAPQIPGQQYSTPGRNHPKDKPPGTTLNLVTSAPKRKIRTLSNSPDPPFGPIVEAAVNAANPPLAPAAKKPRLGEADKASAIRRPKRGKRIPETFAEAEQWDRDLWTMKMQGKGMVAIAERWEATTGESQHPNKPRKLIDDLSARFVKLKQDFAASGTLPVSLPMSCSPPSSK